MATVDEFLSARLPPVSPWNAPWQPITIKASDRPMFDHAFRLLVLVNESARRSFLPWAGHQIVVEVQTTRATVRRLLETGRVALARQIAGDSAELATLIAPPRSSERPATGQEDFQENAEWLDANRGSYVGQWVALRGGRLIGHDASRLTLHRQLDRAGALTRGTLFIKVE
jgi:hypothetical protein